MASQSTGNKLSSSLVTKLLHAVAKESDGNELVSAINNSAWAIPAAIVAAHTSATTDFSALLPGDLLVHIPAVAGNAVFESVVTAGTKPSAAVVGDLYIVLRQMQNAVQSAASL